MAWKSVVLIAVVCCLALRDVQADVVAGQGPHARTSLHTNRVLSAGLMRKLHAEVGNATGG